MLRILTLQPFYGGSHRAFIDGWINHSRHAWTKITLPDRLWKLRMRHSAIHMSDEIDQLIKDGQSWDAIVATDMLNVAEFRSIVNPIIRELPTIVYFHENQFVYPVKQGRKRDDRFAYTNMTSAIAADSSWFNSSFNLESMLDEIQSRSDSSPNVSLENSIERIRANSIIQYPGIEVPTITSQTNRNTEPIRLIWAARWEHDKNPDDLLRVLRLLEISNIEFRISLIGPCFHVVPPAILQIQTEFADKIENWGFMKTRKDYWNALASADVFISTANHEFFGLSVVEGIAAGAYPLLPDRLSYPEVLKVDDFPEHRRFLYDGTPNGLVTKIHELATDRTLLTDETSGHLANFVFAKYGWSVRAAEMDNQLEQLATRSKTATKFDPAL